MIRNPLLRPFEAAFNRFALNHPKAAFKLAPAYAHLAEVLDPIGALSLWSDRWELADFQAGEYGSYKAARWAGPDRFELAVAYRRQALIAERICDILRPAAEQRWDKVEAWSGRARYEIQAVRRARHYDELRERQQLVAVTPAVDDIPF